MAISPLSAKKRQAAGEPLPEAKKHKVLQDFLQDNWDVVRRPSPGLTYIAWLKHRDAWWQHRTKNAKGRIYMDMDQFANSSPARTSSGLLQLNEQLPWALIGDSVQCPVDKEGKVRLDDKGKPKMYTPFSFACQTFQDMVLASYVLDEDQMRFCSMTAPGWPAHAYLDVDCSDYQKGFAAINGKLHEVLTLLLLYINECFEAMMGRPFNTSIQQFGPACTATKFSCHLHFPAEVFTNADHLMAFRCALVEHIKLKHSDGLLGQVDIDTFIDGNVYIKYSNLKMLGSRKPGRENITLYDYENRTYTKLKDMEQGRRFEVLFNELPSSAICNPEGQEFVSWPDVVAKKANIQQRIAAGERLEPSGLKPDYFGIKLEDIQKVAEDNQFELMEERISNDHSVYFKTRNTSHPRECNVGGIDTVHNTWWVGCSVSRWGVYMTCPGAACKGHRKLLIRSPAIQGKEAALSDIVDHIDATLVTNWPDVIEAMIQADIPKEQIVEVTTDTDGAALVESGWKHLATPELKRTTKPLLALVKKQGVVDPMQLKAWGRRVNVEEPPAEVQPVQDLALLKTTGDRMPYPLTPGRVMACLKMMKSGSTSALAEGFHEATKDNIKADLKSAGIVWWDEQEGLWLRRKPSAMKCMLKEVLLPLIHLMPEDGRRTLAYKNAESAGGYNAIIDLIISHMTRKNVVPVEFNRIKHLYPLRRGWVLDFKKLERRRRVKEDYFTFETNCDFLGRDADLSRAIKFTDEIMCINQEMTKFLQRRLGYMLSGEVGVRVMDIWTGEGTNGKTVLERIVAKLMRAGDRSAGFFCKLGQDYFVKAKKSKGAATTESNGLVEARCGASSEPTSGVIDAELIKERVGGSMAVLRGLFGEEFNVQLQVHYLLVLNNMFEVDATVKAFWNKVNIIPFSAQFVENVDTIAYCEALIEDQEANDQMFTWMALGMCDNYTVDGVVNLGETPQLVKAQNARQRKAANSFEKFVADCLRTFEKPASVNKSDPYYKNYILKEPKKGPGKQPCVNMVGLYADWCKDHGIDEEKTMNQAEVTELANRMFGSGQLTSGADRGKKPYLGVRVKLPEDDAEEMMTEFITLVAINRPDDAAEGLVEGYHDKMITRATMFKMYKRWCEGVTGQDERNKVQLSMEACLKELDEAVEKRHGHYVGVAVPEWLSQAA